MDTTGRNIYLASSWHNSYHQIVLKSLRMQGHEVYDFKHPSPTNNGFAWHDCFPNKDNHAKDIKSYMQAIRTNRAEESYAFDKDALDKCDTCILLLPCGRSAHLEAGYAIGKGKEVIILLSEDQFEPELMYLMANHIACSLTEVLQYFHRN